MWVLFVEVCERVEKAVRGSVSPLNFSVEYIMPPRFANVPWTELFKVDIRKGNLID